MDSWKYMSEGRSVCLSEELDFQYDNNYHHHGYNNNKSKLMGCELKPLVNSENNYPLVSNTQALERLDFMDVGFSDEIRKSYSMSSEPSGEVLSDEIGTDYGNVASPSFGEEKDFLISSEFMQSKDMSFVDLKLGRLSDGRVAKNGKMLDANVVPGSSIDQSSPQLKKPRPSTSSYVAYPRCQVLGCNKDLSCYKGYYKRHKVCDEHTRTAKVTVNGMDQRFCQQCSRFHQLTEFDDGKRSCRRRLAAHNKRRRKPQFPSETGTGIINFSSPQAFSEVLPNAIVGRGKFDEWNWAEHVKDEDFVENSNSFFHVSGVAQKNKDIPADVKGNFIGTSTTMVLDSSTVWQSGRALSLLSSQSHNASGQLLPTTLTSPLLNRSGHPDSNTGHVLNNSVDACTAQNGLHKTGMYPVEANNVDHTMITHSDSNTVDPHLLGDGISRESDIRNTPRRHGMILDLLQLSSRLQRIEQQKHSTESDAG